MLNQLILVGRLVENPILEVVDEKDYGAMTLACSRSYKNEEGIYETDFIPIILWQGIAKNTAEYCKKGDLVGIKGRVQSVDDKIQIIAEKITFLANEKEKESDK